MLSAWTREDEEDEDSLKALLQVVNWLSYASCLPLFASELCELNGRKDDFVLYMFLLVYIMFFLNEVILDIFNVACVYSLFCNTSSITGVLVAFMYLILHFWLKCIPSIFVNHSSCPTCQYFLALVNILTVSMLLNQQKR